MYIVTATHFIGNANWHFFRLNLVPIPGFRCSIIESRMPPVFLVKFSQPPFRSPETAHWAILLPTVPYNAGQLPDWGVLYHARKKGFCCFPLSYNTEYERIKDFCLSHMNGLFDYHELTTVNLTDAEIDAACQQISNPRPFNLVTRNCQDWVKEVLVYLVNGGRMHGLWLEEIKSHGWVTTNDICTNCLRSSLPCGCWKS